MDLPRIAACVSRVKEQRLASALKSSASLACYRSCHALRQQVAEGAAPAAVIVDLHDAAAARETIPALRRHWPSCVILVYTSVTELLEAGINDGPIDEVIIADASDAPAMLRWHITRALMRGVADRVAAELKQRLSGSIATVAEIIVRHPGCSTVEALADQIGVHRQTIATWCRTSRFLRPEELLIWCRVLLVSGLLEQTPYSANALAVTLDFPSAIALRNQLKRYTGLTAQEIRRAGLQSILRMFDSAVERARQAPNRESAAMSLGV
jgi:hypothetical protein